MAEMTKYRLKSFTLFESVISITIISVLLAIASMIYGNLMSAENPISEFEAKQEIQTMLLLADAQEVIFNQELEFESYSIKQTVEPFKGNTKLLLLTYEVFSLEGDKWLEQKHLKATNE